MSDIQANQTSSESEYEAHERPKSKNKIEELYNFTSKLELDMEML